MRYVRGGALAVAIAAGTVAAAVAANQIYADGQLSWTWAYLAFGFTLLVALITTYAAHPGQGGRRVPRVRRRVYLRQLRATVADMETIGVVTQGEFVLGMRQVYVDVALRPRPAHTTGRDPGVGPAVQEQVGQRRPLSSFLGEGRVFAVIGSPGSGKTTLARHTALALCGRYWRFWQRRFWRRRRLPVLLYLRDHAKVILSEEPPGLAEVATSVGWLDEKIPASWVKQQLDRGRCVVLLDGLDEVADEQDRKKVVAWVRRQIDRYRGNDWVVTSRPHGYLSNPLPNADVLQVQRFTSGQVAQFLHQWYYANECRARNESGPQVRVLATRKAGDLFARLRSRPALYHLAANPLLLTMIANVHRYRGALPGSRAALYAEMCDVLIHRRQEAKELTDITGLDGPKKETVMRHLALHMMGNRLRDILISDARQAIAEPLGLVAQEGQITPELFLEEVRKSGLLVEREHGVYGFAHLTLQEYLAAAHIREQPDHLRLLTEGVDDPWWRETTLLWAAAGDATAVIDACLACGTIRALTLGFDCADEARQIQPPTRARLNQLLTTPPTLTRPTRPRRNAAGSSPR